MKIRIAGSRCSRIRKCGGEGFSTLPALLTMSLSPSHLNQVLTGDCLKLLPLLPDASVDLVLTDPPYLVRYQSRDGRGVPNDDTDAWLAPAFSELYRVLRRDRFCI